MTNFQIIRATSGIFRSNTVSSQLPDSVPANTIAALTPAGNEGSYTKYWFPIQTSRILLYPAYFFAGVGIGVVSLRAGIFAEDGEIAKRWPVWLAFAIQL